MSCRRSTRRFALLVAGAVVLCCTGCIVRGPHVAPSELSAVALSSTSVSLSWRDNSRDESGFIIERSVSEDSVAFAEVGEVDLDTQHWQDSGLISSVTYFYRVAALNTHGFSGYSNTARVETQEPPSEPAVGPSLSSGVVSADGASVTLTFTEELQGSSPPADSFRLSGTGATVSLVSASGASMVLGLAGSVRKLECVIAVLNARARHRAHLHAGHRVPPVPVPAGDRSLA